MRLTDRKTAETLRSNAEKLREKGFVDSFDAILKKLRKDRNATQKEVSQAIGADQQTLRRYESGERKPDTEMLLRIAKYYNVSADYLLGLSENSTVEPDMKAAVKCTGLSQKAIEGLQDHLTAELEPLETLLGSDRFYDILLQLRILQNTSAQFNDTDDIKRIDLDDKCDMLRYRVSKIMERIIDEFDRRENDENTD